jgi:hypothetical protein
LRTHHRVWTACTGIALVAASLTVTTTAAEAAPAVARPAVSTGTSKGVGKPSKPKPVRPAKPVKPVKGKPAAPAFEAPTTFEYVRSDCWRADAGSFRVVHYWLVSGGVYTYFRNGVGKPVNVYRGEAQTIFQKVTVSDPAWTPEAGPLPAPTEGVATGTIIVAPIGRPSAWQQIELPEQTVALDCGE